MFLMPELKDVYNNHSDIEQITHRYVNHGRWAQADPCAPYDGSATLDSSNRVISHPNRGVTYGPDGSGGCILDTDPNDGIGRFPNMHGANADGGAYSTYRISLADAMWHKYLTDLDPVIDNSATPDPATGTGVFDQIIPVISYGQSIAGGANVGTPQLDDHDPKYDPYSLTLNAGKTAFENLQYTHPEKHDEGMLEVTVEQFLQRYGNSPKFLSINKAVG